MDVDFHFYSKAIKIGGNVVLVTATTPNSRWEEEKGLLLPTVDSLAAVKKE